MSDVAVASVKLILDASLLPAQMGAAIAGLEAQAKAAGANIEKSLAASTKGVAGSLTDLRAVGAEITKIQKQINEQFSGKTNKDVQRSALERRVAAQQLAQDTKRNLDLLGETGKLNDVLAKEATNAHGVRLAELRAEQAELKNLDLAERNRATAASRAIDLQSKGLRLSEQQRRAAESSVKADLAQSKQLLTINQNLREFGQPTAADARAAERIAAQQAAAQAKFAREAERAAAQQLRDIERTAAANLRATEQFNAAQRRVSADADRSAASLERAAKVDFSKQLDTFKRLSGLIGNASEAILKFGAISAATITATTGVIAGLGVKAAANFEQLAIGFESVLGADQGAATLDAVKEFARQTPFATKEVAELSQKLLAVGLADAGSLPGFLDDVAGFGAAAGVTSDNLDGLVRAITQIQGKGKLAGQELIQIAERAPQLNVLKLIADSTGESLGEVYERLEQGNIKADEAIGVIIAGMRNFPGASTALERQLDSLTGRWSELKDTIINTSAALTESSGLGDTVRETMRGITNTIVDEQGKALSTGLGGSLQGFYAEVNKLAQQIGPQIGPLLGSLVEGLGNGIREITPSLQSLIETLTELGPSLGESAGQLGGQFLGAVETLAPVLEVLADALAEIPAPLLALGLVAGKVGGPLVTLTKSLSGVSASTSQFASVAGGANKAIGTGVAGIAAGVSALGLASSDATTQLASFAGVAASVGGAFAVGGPIAGGVAAAAALIGGIAGVFQENDRVAKENEASVRNFADAVTAELVPALQAGAGSLDDFKAAAERLFTTDTGAADVNAIIAKVGDRNIEVLKAQGLQFGELADALAGNPESIERLQRLAADIEEQTLLAAGSGNLTSDLIDAGDALENIINLSRTAQDGTQQAFDRAQLQAEQNAIIARQTYTDLTRQGVTYDRIAKTAENTAVLDAERLAVLDAQAEILEKQLEKAQGLSDALTAGVTNAFGLSPQDFAKDFTTALKGDVEGIKKNDVLKSLQFADFVLKLDVNALNDIRAQVDELVASGNDALGEQLLTVFGSDRDAGLLLADFLKGADDATIAELEKRAEAVFRQEDEQARAWGETTGAAMAESFLARIQSLNVGSLAGVASPVADAAQRRGERGDAPLPVVPSISSEGLQALRDQIKDLDFTVTPTADLSNVKSLLAKYNPSVIARIIARLDNAALNTLQSQLDRRTFTIRAGVQVPNALGSISNHGIPMFASGGLRSNAGSRATIASQPTAIFGESSRYQREMFLPLRERPTSRDLQIFDKALDHFGVRESPAFGPGSIVVNSPNPMAAADLVAARLSSMVGRLG